MKHFIPILFSIFSLTAQAQSQGRPHLICNSDHPSEFFQISLGMGAQGHVTYNFSTAKVSCTGLFARITHTEGKARCYGSWMTSPHRQGSSLNEDAPAWVEVINKGQKVTARFRTAPYYDSKIITLRCNVINVPETSEE